jgi:hypothetical protein
MKYIKTYEDLKFEIQVGDYVQIKTHSSILNVKEFINNNIGIVSNINHTNDDIVVGYYDIPKVIEKFFNKTYYKNNSIFPFTRSFDLNRVVEFGKTKEELEMKILAKKYNL